MLAALTFALSLQKADLKIEDVKPGEGEVVIKPYDVVEVHYVGTLIDGKEFDSSVKRNKPFHFQVGVGAVIKGWEQGVVGMKVGGERNLTIPPELGYGDRAAGDLIPANSILKFNIKVVKIIKSAKIEVLKEGTGEPLKLGNLLECKVSIKLPDGKEIADPNQTAKLEISPRVIPGLNQAIAGIKVGEKRKVTVGWELAFGEKGIPAEDQEGRKAGSIIPPKTDLTMEIEAVKIST